jgi:hypothetical protein
MVAVLPRCRCRVSFNVPDYLLPMTKTRSHEFSENFAEQWQQCRDWLLPFIQNNQLKLLKERRRI